jgi:hypothetical protein
MNWLIPFFWLANLALLSFFLLKLRRDFELSSKRKAFEEDKKERRRQAKEARIRAQQQQEDSMQVSPVTSSEQDRSEQGLGVTKEFPV